MFTLSLGFFNIVVHVCTVSGVFADGPLGPSALTLGNWMLLSQNG